MLIFLVHKDYFLHESKQPENISYRIIIEFWLYNFYLGLSDDNSDEILHETDIDNATESLHSKIINMCNVHWSIKPRYVSPKDRIKPWIKTIIKNHIKIERYFQLFNQNLLPRRLYDNFRNLVTFKIQRAKIQYFKTVYL